MNTKSRNLSPAEYFEALQKEYLLCIFRKKIYFNPADKAYYDRVAGQKKNKIEEIASRNGLDSIFNSTTKLEEINSIVFDKNKKPIEFETEKDFENYYLPKQSFSYKGSIFVLEYLLESRNSGFFVGKKEKKEIQFSEVYRIF